MNTFTLTQPGTHQARNNNVPVTPKGRAIYTTDWFLYGAPRSINYDSANMALKGDRPC